MIRRACNRARRRAGESGQGLAADGVLGEQGVEVVRRCLVIGLACCALFVMPLKMRDGLHCRGRIKSDVYVATATRRTS